MTLEQLRIFVAVADRLHMTRAAEDVGITQSGASAAIAALEARYGVALFNRVGRRLELTEAGQTFLPTARAVIDYMSTAVRLLNDLSPSRRVTLAISATPVVANYWLPPRLAKFRGMYADIKISLKVGSVADVAEAVIKGKVDLGFLEEQFSDPLIQDSNLPGDRLVLVVAETHPWGARRKVSVQELMSEMWIMREKGTEADENLRNSLSRINIDVGQIKNTLELPTDEAVIAAVEGGAGVAVVSSFAMQGRAKLRSINIGLEPRHFRVIYHRERSKTVVQQALLKMMANWPSQSPESQPIPFVRNSASLRRALT